MDTGGQRSDIWYSRTMCHVRSEGWEPEEGQELRAIKQNRLRRAARLEEKKKGKSILKKRKYSTMSKAREIKERKN